MTMAVSSFLIRKIDRRFERLDLDGNGYVDGADFAQAAHRMGNAFGVLDSDPKLTRLTEIMGAMWMNLSELADSDHDGHISREEYRAAFVQVILPDQQSFTLAYAPFIRALMDIADTDGDGRLGPDEYAR